MTRTRANNIRRDSGYYGLMAGNSKELTGRGLGRGNMVVWKQWEEQEGQPIQSPKSVVPTCRMQNRKRLQEKQSGKSAKFPSGQERNKCLEKVQENLLMIDHGFQRTQ